MIMKMKSNISIIATLLTGVLLFGSACEDFLDKEPLGDLTTGAFYETPEDAVLATNAIYNAYRAWFVTGGFPIADIMSDDMAKGSSPGDAANLNLIDSLSFAATEGAFSNIWAALFAGVRRANVALEEIPQIDMEASLQQRLLAEAHFLRAAFYFELARSYGNIPKVTTANPDRQLGRSPVSEIYNEIIIPDLQFATENLPQKSEYDARNLGRATEGAANALLAKVYLYLENYEGALEQAQEVISSGEYSLAENFSDVFAPDNNFGPGSIFEIGALEDNFSNGGNQYGQTQGVRGTVQIGEQSTGKGWGFGRPTVDIINFFEEGDPRLDESVIFLGDTIYGEVIIGDQGTPDTTYRDGEIIQLETYNQKVYEPGVGDFVQFDHNRKILRYAGLLLIAAEAANELGQTDLALQYLNQVRLRAFGDPAAAITDTSQDALRDRILAERRAELAFEGERFYDLVRTGRAAEALGPLGFQEGRNELFPIPQSEIDITEGTIDQNPGY
jgi:tetratricopeptide (TPR) repeat protein